MTGPSLADMRIQGDEMYLQCTVCFWEAPVSHWRDGAVREALSDLVAAVEKHFAEQHEVAR